MCTVVWIGQWATDHQDASRFMPLQMHFKLPNNFSFGVYTVAGKPLFTR